MPGKLIRISEIAYKALEEISVNKGDMMKLASQAILLYLRLGGESFLIDKSSRFLERKGKQ